jgi:GT2 family glycosyltransferase
MDQTKNRPTVAVIVPYYNGSKWIERAIKSVVSQTVPPDEFVIVNDGSKPDERAALVPLATKYGFRIIDKANGGQGSARNAGVAATKAEFISLLDQDDFYLPQHIEDLLELVPERDLRLGYVYADLCEGDEDGNIVHSNMLRQQVGMHPKQGNITHMLGHDLHVLPSASLILRSAFEAVGGFDEQFMGYEDDDLFLRLFRAGYTNYYLDKPVTVWCMHTGSTSWSVKMSRSRFKYFRKLVGIYGDEPKKNRFYLKDCLIPRFGPAFVNEAKKADKDKSPDASELLDILCAYRDIVEVNKNVEDDYKRYLARVINIIKGEPVTKEIYGTYQESLYQCYLSTSWKITWPLRLGSEDLIPDDEETAYERFMRVRASLSWKVAAPVRIAKLALRRLVVS